MTYAKQPTSVFSKLPVILVLALAYLCFWNWSEFYYVYTYGEFRGPDDFLRMSQVHAWMNGQNWFDITAYNMVPPSGGDIHWSRLVDVPIAALIVILDVFTSFEKATYLASIIWPLMLMLITITVWTLVCDRLLENYHRWLPAFFGVLTISSINQFSAGRVDHHNIQILLFGLMVLGLVNRDRSWGDYLIGFAVAFSISIGAETLIVLILVLSVIGIEWAIGADKNGRGIFKVGLALIISSLVLYAVNFHPRDYFNTRCDANSFFFLSVFCLIGLAFCGLGISSFLFSKSINTNKIIGRLLSGALLAGVALVILYLAFPDCLGDPFATMSAETKTRWLSKVSEAKSLSQVLHDFPHHWFSTVGYYLFVLLVGAFVLFNKNYRTIKVASLYIILFACVMGTLWQVRVVRTAAFLVVPFCTIFSMICWEFLKEKYQSEKFFLYGFQSGVVFFQISIVWYIAGAIFLPPERIEQNKNSNSAKVVPTLQSDLARREPGHCLASVDFEFLNTLPKANIVSDLSTSTAVLFHTNHSVISGPYHRNERAILDTLDFMGTDEATAKVITKKYQLAYLGLCTGKKANKRDDYGPNSVTAKIFRDDIPSWMEEISTVGEKFRVFKIGTN